MPVIIISLSSLFMERDEDEELVTISEEELERLESGVDEDDAYDQSIAND